MTITRIKIVQLMNLHKLKKFTIGDEIIGDHDMFGAPDT